MALFNNLYITPFWCKGMPKKSEYIWLLLIVVVGLGLRLYQLDTESFWTDEAFSVHHAKLESAQEVVSAVSITEAAPAGYYLLLHYWIKIFGDDMFIVRLLSVFFSAAAPIVLFFIIRLFANSRVALLGSFFMATSMLQIEYAQEARMYGLFTFVSLCIVYFFARWFWSDKKNNSLWMWCYGLSALVGFWVNYMTAFLVLGLTLVLLFSSEKWKKQWKTWLMMNVGVIFLFLLPAPYTLKVMLSQFASLNTGLEATLISKGVPAFLAQLGLFFFTLPALLFALLAGLFLAKAEIKSALLKVDNYFFLVMLTVGTFYLYVSLKPLIISSIPVIRVPITNSYFLIRHSFYLVPLWYVYLAYKIDQYFFDAKRRQKVLAVFCFVLILFFSSSALFLYYSLPTKAQWSEAAVFISERDATGKPLILLDKGGFSNEFLLKYYLKRPFSLLKLTWSEKGREFHQLSDEAVLRALESSKDGFWLVLSRNPATGTYYHDLLNQHYQQDIQQEFYQIEVYHYIRK